MYFLFSILRRWNVGLDLFKMKDPVPYCDDCCLLRYSGCKNTKPCRCWQVKHLQIGWLTANIAWTPAQCETLLLKLVEVRWSWLYFLTSLGSWIKTDRRHWVFDNRKELTCFMFTAELKSNKVCTGSRSLWVFF